MDFFLTDKLAAEIGHYQDKDFVKAAMAVCALTALADGRMDRVERLKIERVIKSEPGLREFDFEKASEILERYCDALQRHGDVAQNILYNKVRRMAGHRKKARTLLRAAYLIIQADHVVQDEEKREFQRLCEVVELEPGVIWRELESTES